jgi:hypothetical protein
MKKCPLCGDVLYSSNDGPLCFRCKESGARLRLEIYDKDPYSKKEDSFTKTFIGGTNYKDMQSKNIRRGGFS